MLDILEFLIVMLEGGPSELRKRGKAWWRMRTTVRSSSPEHRGKTFFDAVGGNRRRPRRRKADRDLMVVLGGYRNRVYCVPLFRTTERVTEQFIPAPSLLTAGKEKAASPEPTYLDMRKIYKFKLKNIKFEEYWLDFNDKSALTRYIASR